MPPEDKALYRLHAFILHMHHTDAIGEETLVQVQTDLKLALEQAEAKGHSAGFTQGHQKGYEAGREDMGYASLPGDMPHYE